MKVSLQQLLAFRTSTDQVARSRLSGVVNGPQPVASATTQKIREAGPALTLLATSNTFIAESFFVTSGPLTGEYQTRERFQNVFDLRAIEVPSRLLASLVQKLLQGADGQEADPIRRLMAMPVIGEGGSTREAMKSQHAANYVTFYNSYHDHANAYAVLFKPDRHEVEVALYRNAVETPGAAPRGETLPALPFFRQRIDIGPLLEAAERRAFGGFANPSGVYADASLAEEDEMAPDRDWSKRAAWAGGWPEASPACWPSYGLLLAVKPSV